MQINRVTLNNFRQFYGEQKIDFPVEGQRNVTLIHAENGFGKTSILNAVLWSLFKQVTPKFERSDDIVNYEALEEGITSASVDVCFSFQDNDYLVQRTFDENHSGRDRTRLVANRIEDGNYKSLRAPESFISSVVPSEMAKYFFFDGEAAESFTAARNYKEISRAIRTILGCSLAETAISDLKTIGRTIARQIGATSGDDEIVRIESSVEKLEIDIEKCEQVRESKIDDIKTLKDMRKNLHDQLRGLDAAKHLQERRDRKNRQKKTIAGDIHKTRSQIIKWIGRSGLPVVSRKLSKIGLDFVDEESLKGRIPSPYNEEFVKGLLQIKQCICGRPLEPESECWRSVSELLRTAANAEVLNKVVRIRTRMEVLKRDAGVAPSQLTDLQKKWKELLDRRGVVEQELDEISKKLRCIPTRDIAEKEKALRITEKRISQFEQELGGLKATIAAKRKQKDTISRDLNELARKNRKTTKLVGKKDLIERAGAFLNAMLVEYETGARSMIEKRINDILEEVAHKDFSCVFNSDFSIDMIHENRVTAKSAGENQLLSLAFIAALVEFSASRIHAEDLILRPGTLAPLVLDAPLGQLDPSYQQSVAEFLPKLAHQVILLVSGSQGGDKVLEKLAPHVAAEYVLIQDNAGQRKNHKLMERVIHGKQYDLIRFGQKHTMTHIERIQ